MLKVYLKFPFKISDSPYYKYLVQYPPKNIKYITESKPGIISNPTFFRLINRFKNTGRSILEKFGFPNIVNVKNIDADVVHCAHCLLKNDDIPWVVDFEHYWTLAASSKIAYSNRGKLLIRKRLLSDSCKAILPWTNAAKKTLLDAIRDKRIEEKTFVVYPAIPAPSIKIKKPKNEVNMLFIGRYFFAKGGLYFLNVVKRLKEKYDNINATLISYTIPNEYVKKYSYYVDIRKRVGDEELFGEIFPKSHVFLYPGFSDTFGFAFLEAMAYGLSIVTVDGFARREIVNDGKGGFVIKMPVERVTAKLMYSIYNEIASSLYEKTKEIIETRKLLRKMGSYNRKVIEKGKFSIPYRNKILIQVFKSF